MNGAAQFPGVPLNPGGAAAQLPEGTAGTQPGRVPPRQANWQARSAALQAEYVAGGGYHFLAQYIRSLPFYIDDVTRDFGDDQYDQILLDPQCSSAVRTLKEKALSSGIRLQPAVESEQSEWYWSEPDVEENLPAREKGGRFRPKTDEEIDAEEEAAQQKKDADLSEEITDFCEQNLKHLQRPFVDICNEMLMAVALGNKVAEKVFEIRKEAGEAPKMWMKALKVKPRKSVAFVMDAYNNCVGLIGLLPGQGYPVLAGTTVMEPDQIPNLLPREKFAVFTWGAVGDDPRGTSLLRPVYNFWWLKQNTLGEYAKYLSKFAGPSLVGYTAPNAQPVPQTDSLGNPIPGLPLITPEQAMLNALLNFANGSAVVFPAGAKVDPLSMSGDGGAYRNAITMFDQQITKGIMLQTLATDEGQNMARAAAETHENILDVAILHIKSLLAAMIYRDILFPLVKYNWGEEIARRLTPIPHLAETQQHNWAKDAAAVAALVTSQYMDRSQFAAMDARLGLPERAAGSGPQTGPVAPSGAGGGAPPKGMSIPGGSGGMPAPASAKSVAQFTEGRERILNGRRQIMRRKVKKEWRVA